jgi:hypothetical protein
MSDRLYVRCCCQPQKILGTLPAPRNDGPSVTFAYAELTETGPATRFVSLPLATFMEAPILSDEALISLSPEAQRSMIHRERAYKAEGMTIDELKKIPVFVPA